jgi:hypothetical protein
MSRVVAFVTVAGGLLLAILIVVAILALTGRFEAEYANPPT